MIQRFSAIWSDQLGEAIKKASVEPYEMALGRSDSQTIVNAINQGIDSYLEAIETLGNSQLDDNGRLCVAITPDTLYILVRRLMESDDDNALSLASDICSTLNIELI